MNKNKVNEVEEVVFHIEDAKRRCKRHNWKSGWICEKCGMKRYDYEFYRKEVRR